MTPLPYLFDDFLARVRRLPPELVRVQPRGLEEGGDVVLAAQRDRAEVVAGADGVGSRHVEHVL